MQYFAMVIIILLLVPVFRFLCKRLSALIAIRKVCKQHGYRYVSVNRFVLFSGMKRKNCDFYIISDRSIYSVKIAGMFCKGSCINFINETTYAVKIVLLRFASSYHSILFKEKTKSPFDFKYRYPEYAYDRVFVPILLYCPVAMRITKTSGTATRQVGNGDDIDECVFYTKSGFIKRLNHDESNSMHE